MGVAVFDSDVVIGYLNRNDAHHDEARQLMRRAAAPRTRRQICAVTLAEVLVGPLRAGRAQTIWDMVAGLSFEIIPADTGLSTRAAAVRAEKNLKLPDAFAVATALAAQRGGSDDVRLETFDQDVRKAYPDLVDG